MQVTYQMKIFTVAIFSVIILKKQLSFNQWIALGMLAMAVIFVQVYIQASLHLCTARFYEYNWDFKNMRSQFTTCIHVYKKECFLK